LSGSARERNYRKISIDSRQTNTGDLFIALKGEQHDGHDFLFEARRRGAAGFVVSRVPEMQDNTIQIFEVPDTIKALHELAAKVRSGFDGQVVGITGSNGKTTTKEMLANVLSTKYRVHRNPGNYNNLIGLPLTIFEMKKVDWMVLEMGSNAPGEISTLSRIANPHWGIITNISEAHLEGFGNIIGVLEEKASILKGIRSGGTLIIGGDDPSLKTYVKNHDVNCVTFGLRKSNDVCPEEYAVQGDGTVSFRLDKGPVIHLPVIGFYTMQNALAAYALGLQIGMSHEEIKQGLEMPLYQSLRMEVTREFGLTFINDCYNANPRSMFLAAEALSLMEGEGRKILVLGDMYELGEGSARLHKELGKRLSLLDLDVVVAVGGLGAIVARAIRDEDQRRGRKRDIVDMMEFTAACDFLCENVQPNDFMLFKASRGMKLENLFEMVRSKLKEGGAPD
jgi:UDP-N-acetylmuramoyl-tripeptide--D-alanyl-D-alanine ligase